MANSLAEVLHAISPYDSEDLVSAAGALQLLPVNAERIIRLEALAHAATSVPVLADKLKISSPRLRMLLKSTLYRLFGPAEDPPPDCVVEEIPFFGGSYKVFSGAIESLPFIIRNLTAAIFLSPQVTQKRYVENAYEVVAAVLLVSNEVASRAGLRRGLDPIGGSRDVKIPFADVLGALKNAVKFTEDELLDLLARRKACLSSILPLVSEAGVDHLTSYTVQVGALHSRPVVRFGKIYLVTCPSLLLDALAHRLNCLAIQHGVEREYAIAYNHAVRASVAESLRYLRNPLTSPLPAKVSLPATVSELFAEPDRDKQIHVLVVTDSLEGYDISGQTRQWDMKELTARLEERIQQVEQQIHADDPDRRILFLLVHQATGRAYGCGQRGRLANDQPGGRR